MTRNYRINRIMVLLSIRNVIYRTDWVNEIGSACRRGVNYQRDHRIGEHARARESNFSLRNPRR